MTTYSSSNPPVPVSGLYEQVGYWAGGYPADPNLPRVEDFQDASWEEGEQEAVVAHLVKGEVHRSYRGFSPCRICRKPNGSQDMTDGRWVWPSGFAHYVTEHQVKPPQDFISHVLAKVSYRGLSGLT